MPDDQALLLRYARSRDAVAFAQLVQRYSTLVFSVACRVTGNAATAEDVTQDCFLKLARQAASIRGSLPAWLHRVALNRSLDVTRKEAARKRHETRSAPISDPDYDPPWNQIAPLVDAALVKLPDDLREPLVQHYLLGRTQTQVAENLHVDQATISRRLLKGIKMLREHLKETGLLCGAAALSTALVKNASAAVPARLSASLAKMAMAGPTAIAATAATSAILAVNAKLIAAIASVVVVGTVLTYHFASLHNPKAIDQSGSAFTPRPYLSKLVLQGDGYTQDSFSLAFQAAANIFGRNADYETIYALSTNAFCPGIEDTHQQHKSFWHVQAWLGDKAIHTLCARYGLIPSRLDSPGFAGDAGAYRRAIVPTILQTMQAGNVVLVDGGWEDNAPYWPWAGIITDVQPGGVIFGATLNGRQDNPLKRPRGIWSIAPAAMALPPHEADIALLRLIAARIRSQAPFEARSQSIYGLKAMDAWIKAMSETPGFCAKCMEDARKGNKWDRSCARINAQTTQIASIVAARYLRRIAPDFLPPVQSNLESAAAHYQRIAEFLAPAIADTGPDSYANILGNLSRQKAHVAKVLMPIRSEYLAIAQDIEIILAFGQTHSSNL